MDATATPILKLTPAERSEATRLAVELVERRAAAQEGRDLDHEAAAFDIVTADTIQEEDVSFLSERPPIIENTINLVEGNPDTGKTLVMLDVVAAATTGRPFPFGKAGAVKPRKVLYLTAEDSLSTTIVKRLRAAGADLSRVYVQQPTGAELLLPGALEMLKHIVDRLDIGIVFLDPLNGYLDASEVDVNKEQEVRQALRPVRDFAESAGVTIVGLRHLNKASDKPAMYRGGGSIALTAVARSTLLVARHPEDPALRVVVVQKCNVVPDQAKRPIGFRIGQDGSGRPRVEWLPEDIEIDADELLAPRKPGPRADTLEQAKRYLGDLLAHGPKLRREVLESAERVHLSARAVERAVQALGVVSLPQGKERLWRLP